MGRYNMSSAALYTPPSIRAPALGPCLLWVATLLVSTFSFYFPLLDVRGLILLLDSLLSGCIYYEPPARGLTLRASELVKLSKCPV